MTDATRRTTAAESFVRGLFDDEESKAADLCVLALERALIRGGHRFFVRARDDIDDASRMGFADASSPVGPEQVVSIGNGHEGAQCEHVRDWIESSILNGAAWLDRTDREGRPLKLMKLGSLKRAVAEADKATRRFAAQVSSTVLGLEDEIVHAQLEDGWTLVRLVGPRALGLESGRMQHCIGQGAYDKALSDEDVVFLSMRDPAGRPHATLELMRSKRFGTLKVVQLQGKQNTRPIERHMRRIRPWLRANAAAVDPDSRARVPAWWSGYARVAGGRMVDLFDMPASMDLLDDLEMVLDDGVVLPSERLASGGDVELVVPPGRTTPVVLPRRIEIEGRLVLRGDATFVFGDAVRAETIRTLDCRLEALPSDLSAKGCSFANTDVGSIPASAKTGILQLPGSHAVLGEGFSAPSIDMTGSRVETLPRGLSADKLVLSDCPVREIPDGTRTRHLRVIGRDLRRIGRVEDLHMLELKDVRPDLHMPAAMAVVNKVTVAGPGFPHALPAKLSVGQELRIERTPGLELPPELDVGKLVAIDRCFAEIPSGTRIRDLLQLIDAGDVDVGEDCRIADIVVIEAADAREAGRAPRMVSVEPGPAISRIEADGSTRLRDAAPSP